MCEKVRLDGKVRDATVLIASGVNLQGKRLILGVSVSLGDAHVGLQAARKAVSRGSIVSFTCSRTSASMRLAKA